MGTTATTTTIPSFYFNMHRKMTIMVLENTNLLTWRTCTLSRYEWRSAGLLSTCVLLLDEAVVWHILIDFFFFSKLLRTLCSLLKTFFYARDFSHTHNERFHQRRFSPFFVISHLIDSYPERIAHSTSSDKLCHYAAVRQIVISSISRSPVSSINPK